MTRAVELWVYVAASPLLWLTATVGAYLVSDWISARFNRHPLANPLPIAVLILLALLVATGTTYETYFAGAQFVHFLLGPATVALAVPLVRHLPQARRSLLPILVALAAGSFTGIASAVLFGRLLGLDQELLKALAPKSATIPIAMGVAEKIGSDPGLVAVVVLLTGITGAIVATPMLNLLGFKDYAARGFSVGLASHGIGTARAIQVNPVAGAFAAMALGLNGLLTSLLAPLVLPMLM